MRADRHRVFADRAVFGRGAEWRGKSWQGVQGMGDTAGLECKNSLLLIEHQGMQT